MQLRRVVGAQRVSPDLFLAKEDENSVIITRWFNHQ